jgi:hypothetical protein
VSVVSCFFFKSSSMVTAFFKLKDFRINAMYLDNLDASASIKCSGYCIDCTMY